MHSILAHRKILVFLLLFISGVFLAASFYVQEQRSDYVLTTQVKIAEQETTLAALAELTDRDGADAVVEAIIKDCSLQNRERFDTLLGKLAELNTTELKEIEQLFNACGNFYAERKAVMVARLEREFEVYLDLIEMLARADAHTAEESYNTEGWGALVGLEKERSTLSTALVAIQGEIIQKLRDNVSIASEDMQTLLVEGQQTRDSLLQLSTQIDTQRQSVLSL